MLSPSNGRIFRKKIIDSAKQGQKVKVVESPSCIRVNVTLSLSLSSIWTLNSDGPPASSDSSSCIGLGLIHLRTRSLALFVNLWTLAYWDPLSVGFSRVGCHALLQGIFPTQGSNLHLLWLLNCRWILCHWATGVAILYIVVCICQPHPPTLLLPTHSLVTTSLFSVSVTLFLFCR